MLLDVADHALVDWSVESVQQVVHVRGDDVQQLPVNGQSIDLLQNSFFPGTSVNQGAAVLFPESSPCIQRSVYRYACQQAVACVETRQS